MSKEKNIIGIILAAGASSRMGSPKALLKISGTTFTEVIKGKLNKAGIKQVYLVLGAGASRIRGNLNMERLNIIINDSWEKGQLSSLKKAVNELSPETDAVMMALIDHPQVKTDTIKKLIKVFRDKVPDIVLPQYRGRGGHPVIFSRSVFNQILKAPLTEGARVVVRNKANNVVRLEVDDKYIRQDIDTKKDFGKIESKKSDI
ncbi:MAG: nucleotidyltransferase family protein [Elusimicrobiota bacterium]|nr:nucleotidyltransferase family protein [Elusimicrobiota bacterium]